MLDQVRTSFRCWMAAQIAMPVIVAILALSIDISAQQKSSVVGDYTSKADPTVRLHLKFNAEGALTGSIDLLDQYEVGDALKEIHFDGETLRFSITGHTGFWEGTFSSDGNSLEGKWTEWGAATADIFTRDVPSAVAKLSPVEGIWLGALPAGAATLRIQVIVKSDAAGRLSCTVDSPGSLRALERHAFSGWESARRHVYQRWRGAVELSKTIYRVACPARSPSCL